MFWKLKIMWDLIPFPSNSYPYLAPPISHWVPHQNVCSAHCGDNIISHPPHLSLLTSPTVAACTPLQHASPTSPSLFLHAMSACSKYTHPHMPWIHATTHTMHACNQTPTHIGHACINKYRHRHHTHTCTCMYENTMQAVLTRHIIYTQQQQVQGSPTPRWVSDPVHAPSHCTFTLMACTL
jgi:hypothetical protein